MQQAIPSISTMALTAAVSLFGISAIAAYGVSGKLEIILFYPAMVFNMALTSIVGQCIGAGRPDRAQDYLKLSLVVGGITLAILSTAVVGFSAQLSGLFVKTLCKKRRCSGNRLRLLRHRKCGIHPEHRDQLFSGLLEWSGQTRDWHGNYGALLSCGAHSPGLPPCLRWRYGSDWDMGCHIHKSHRCCRSGWYTQSSCCQRCPSPSGAAVGIRGR